MASEANKDGSPSKPEKNDGRASDEHKATSPDTKTDKDNDKDKDKQVTNEPKGEEKQELLENKDNKSPTDTPSNKAEKGPEPERPRTRSNKPADDNDPRRKTPSPGRPPTTGLELPKSPEDSIPDHLQQDRPKTVDEPQLDSSSLDIPVITSPKLVTPRSLVSPPLTGRTLNHPIDGGFCDICPTLMKHGVANKAEFTCDTCEQRFCVRCAKRHIETPVFSKHEMVPLMTSEDDLTSLKDLPCKVHPKRNLEYYCLACQVIACGMCITFGHGGQKHQNITVSKLPNNRHLLLARYELLIRGEQSPVKDRTPIPKERPLPFLLWKCQSFRTASQSKSQKVDPSDLCGPCDVAFLPGGQLIVADRWNQSVKLFDEEGTNPQIVLEKIAPIRLCCTSSGRVAVVDDYGQGQIKIINSRYLKSKMKPRNEGSESKGCKQSTDKPNKSDPHSKSVSESIGTATDDDYNDTGYVNYNRNKAENTPKREDNMNSRMSQRSNKSQGIYRDISVILNSDDEMEATEIWKPRDVSRPWAIAVTSLGQWVVAEYEQYVRSSVNMYDFDGSCVRSFGGIGERDDQFEWAAYIDSDNRGRIIVSDYYNHTVKIFDPKGNFVTKLGTGWGKKDGNLTFPKGVCIDSDDHILVVDSGNNRICEFAPDGSFVRNVLTSDDGLNDPEGIAFIEVPADDRPPPPEKPRGKTPQQEQSRNSSQMESIKSPMQPAFPSKRLAVTLSRGHEYSALLVYGLQEPQYIS